MHSFKLRLYYQPTESPVQTRPHTTFLVHQSLLPRVSARDFCKALTMEWKWQSETQLGLERFTVPAAEHPLLLTPPQKDTSLAAGHKFSSNILVHINAVHPWPWGAKRQLARQTCPGIHCFGNRGFSSPWIPWILQQLVKK